jgi:hypothetical protein
MSKLCQYCGAIIDDDETCGCLGARQDEEYGEYAEDETPSAEECE